MNMATLVTNNSPSIDWPAQRWYHKTYTCTVWVHVTVVPEWDIRIQFCWWIFCVGYNYSYQHTTQEWLIMKQANCNSAWSFVSQTEILYAANLPMPLICQELARWNAMRVRITENIDWRSSHKRATVTYGNWMTFKSSCLTDYIIQLHRQADWSTETET